MDDDDRKGGEETGRRNDKRSVKTRSFAELIPDNSPPSPPIRREKDRKDEAEAKLHKVGEYDATQICFQEEEERNNVARTSKGGSHASAHSRSGMPSANHRQTPALGMLAMQQSQVTTPLSTPGGSEQRYSQDVPQSREPTRPSNVASQFGAPTPGAFPVFPFDHVDDDDAGTVEWRSGGDNVEVEYSTAEQEETPPQEDHLVTATLVTDEPPAPTGPSAPLVIATRLKQSCLNDRRVQAAIAVVVLTAIGLTVWAVTRPPPPAPPNPSDMPSQQPSAAPSFSPGTLVGRFCSQDPYNGNGGDFCPQELPCRACPSPNERLSACLHENTPIQLLETYCGELATGTRQCGNDAPQCPLANYCIPCNSYTPIDSLDFHVCLPPNPTSRRSLAKESKRNLQEQFETDGYGECVFLNENGGALPPTAFPTSPPVFPPGPVDPPVSPPVSAPFSSPGPTTYPPSVATEIPATYPPSVATEIEEFLASMSLDGGAALNTSGSPQSNAFDTLLTDPLVTDYSDEDLVERYALIVFYYSTEGNQWWNSSGWLTEEDVCNWDLIECDANSAVTRIVSPNNNLLGPLPPELYLLDSLVFLGLRTNQVSGAIPSGVGLLSNLVNLDLDSNQLDGPIPSELGMLLSAEYLYLNNNQLRDTIPSSLGSLTNLRSLILSNNDLTGSVPQEVCNLGLGSLQVLSVDAEVDCSSCGTFADTCHPIGSA